MSSSAHVVTGWLQMSSHSRMNMISQSVSESVRVKARVTLRLAVYRQSVGLGAKPLEAHDQSLIFFIQLNPYGKSPCVTSSLTRRWACPL
jgi:hypothetical protein